MCFFSESYQYAIIKDGKLHIQTGDRSSLEFLQTLAQQEPTEEQNSTEEEEENTNSLNSDCDTDVIFSKITGRNLITGQTVTLDKYMNRLQKKTNPAVSKTNQQENVDAIINKKLVLGRTSNGKRLIGKILKITKSGEKNEPATDKTPINHQALQETEDIENEQGNILFYCFDLPQLFYGISVLFYHTTVVSLHSFSVLFYHVSIVL